jgi:iron complex outermembrane receptor protein
MSHHRTSRRHGAERWLTTSALLVPLIAPLAHAQDNAAEADADESTTETVIVTGTRATGVDTFTSSSPVQVLAATEIEAAGRPDLMNALANVVPSFTAQAFGGDMANQTLQAKMRGLSPNHTLVLVNGKRRHTTASLAILGGPYQGGAGVDLNFIPVDAIERVEVLTEGAAAQYGTDAIAGVINVILKKNSDGGGASYSQGQYKEGDGELKALQGGIGFEGPGGSFVSFAAEYREKEHSFRGGIDPRVVNPSNVGPGSTFPNNIMPNADHYPYLNRIFGDGSYTMKLVTMNAGMPVGDDVEFYSTLTFGDKHAGSYQNYRLPNRVSYLNPMTGEREYLYPEGFSPREETEETDYQGTVGAKGEIGAWNWDVSSSYGKDDIDMYTRNSANASLYANTGFTPVNFYDGNYTQTQWTSNADLSREFDLGMATPLNLAFGAEFRKETWRASAGDEASRYLEGGQSFPGISLSDAGGHGRDVTAAYVDVAIEPMEKLRLNLAGRYEDYSDFGDTQVGKLSARYEFTDSFAMRGTASTGFRAPTLAESYYSATNVGPSTAFVQMPPNAPATAILGLGAGLAPEKSTNYSLGFVFRPERAFNVSLDVYQVEVRNRIAATSTFYGTIDGELYSQVIVDAIIANGNVLDPAVTAEGDTGINLFTNGVTTRTRGAEILFSFAQDTPFVDIDWTAAINYNKTEVTKVRDTPTEFGTTQPLFDFEALSDLQDTSPRFLANVGATFQFDKLKLGLHGLYYGKSFDYDNDSGATLGLDPQDRPPLLAGDVQAGDLIFYKNEVEPTLITNFELSWDAMDTMTLTLGATNLFDEMPDKRNASHRTVQALTNDNSAVAQYPSFSPFGINGAYYYGTLTFRF